MRIEAYTQVQQLYKTQKTRRSAATEATESAKDYVQISGRGKDYQTVKTALESTPDVREDLTSVVKARIQNGTYNVDNNSFAEKLLEKYNALI